MLVELTNNRAIMPEIADQSNFLEHDKRMHAGPGEFCAIIPELEKFREAPFLPLSLFLQTPGYKPLEFFSPSESRRPVLNRANLSTLNLLRAFRRLILLASFFLPLAVLFYYLKVALTPAWNVDLNLVQARNLEVARLETLQSRDRQALSIANERLSPAGLLKLIYGAMDPSYRLSKISCQTNGRNFLVEIVGTAPEKTSVALDSVCSCLNGSFPAVAPGSTSQAQITRNEVAEEPGSAVPKVNFELSMTLTPHLHD